MMPPGSVVIVELLDVSRQDVEATMIASQVIEGVAAPPIDFELRPPSALKPNKRYAVRARIAGPNEQLMWATDTISEPPTDGSPITLMCARSHSRRESGIC